MLMTQLAIVKVLFIYNLPSYTFQSEEISSLSLDQVRWWPSVPKVSMSAPTSLRSSEEPGRPGKVVVDSPKIKHGAAERTQEDLVSWCSSLSKLSISAPTAWDSSEKPGRPVKVVVEPSQMIYNFPIIRTLFV